MLINLKYLYFCNLIWDNNNPSESIIDLILKDLKIKYKFSESEENNLLEFLKAKFITQNKRKWTSVNRTKDRFQLKYEEFLQKNITIECEDADFLNLDTSVSNINISHPKINLNAKKVGRPL